MANGMTGQELGTQLCEALGLDPSDVLSLTLRCGVDDLAVVTVERVVTDEDGIAIGTSLRAYDLVFNEEVAHGEDPR